MRPRNEAAMKFFPNNPMANYPMAKNMGFTLPGALVLVGVISIVIFGFLKTQSYQVQVQNLIRGKRAGQDARQIFEASLTKAFRAALDAGAGVSKCFNTAALNSALPGFGTMTFATNVLSTYSTAALSQIAPKNAQEDIIAAKSRCLTPRMTDAFSDQHRYGCVNFQKIAGAPAGNFLSGDGAFSEIYVEARDFRTGGAISCAQAATTKAYSGAWILYAIYWAVPSAEGTLWQVTKGAINVSSD